MNERGIIMVKVCPCMVSCTQDQILAKADVPSFVWQLWSWDPSFEVSIYFGHSNPVSWILLSATSSGCMYNIFSRWTECTVHRFSETSTGAIQTVSQCEIFAKAPIIFVKCLSVHNYQIGPTMVQKTKTELIQHPFLMPLIFSQKL